MNCFLKRQSANAKAKIAGNTSVPGITLVDHCHKRESLLDRGKLIDLTDNMEVSRPNSMKNNMGLYDNATRERALSNSVNKHQTVVILF